MRSRNRNKDKDGEREERQDRGGFQDLTVQYYMIPVKYYILFSEDTCRSGE